MFTAGLFTIARKTYMLSQVQLCIPIGCSPLGSSVHGILQARILEWVAMFSSRGSTRLG